MAIQLIPVSGVVGIIAIRVVSFLGAGLLRVLLLALALTLALRILILLEKIQNAHCQIPDIFRAFSGTHGKR
jgi:hypothetical protein